MRRESRCFTLSLLSVWEDEHILIFVLIENKVEFSRPVATRALTERKINDWYTLALLRDSNNSGKYDEYTGHIIYYDICVCLVKC